MTSIYFATPGCAMFDSSKGSMTNRYQCAKEHFKNNLSATVSGAAIGAAGAAGVIVAKKQPKIYLKVADKLGKLLGKSDKIAKHIPDALKRGKVGLAVAGAIALVGATLHAITSYSYKSGQIDQKYTDAAKLESQTKNLVLE